MYNCYLFCGERLAFLNSVCHPGHILSYNPSDNDDIVFKSQDLLKKANLLFCKFNFCNPHTLTFLFRSYCLSLYGCSLWWLDSPSMNLIEVAFNKMLRHIWKLPSNSHTRIVHSTACLLNLINVVFACSLSLLSSALSCPSLPVSFIYRVSSNLVYTSCGFNCLHGLNYKKTYYPEDLFCANIIRDIRISCVSSGDFEHVISVISSY